MVWAAAWGLRDVRMVGVWRWVFNLVTASSLLLWLIAFAAINVNEYGEAPRPVEWLLLGLFGILPAARVCAALLRVRRRGELARWERRRAKGQCPLCGYDMRTTPSRCPECAWPVDHQMR